MIHVRGNESFLCFSWPANTSAEINWPGRLIMRNASVSSLYITIICYQLLFLLHPILSCQLRYLAEPLEGQRCLSNNDTKIFADKSREFCIWKCLSQERCFYVNYNTVSGKCFVGFDICAALTTAPDFTVTPFYPTREECTEWVPYTVNPRPVGVVTMLTGIPKQFVARVTYQTHVVPGKIHPNYMHSFWTSLGSQVVNHYYAQDVPAVEVMTIDVSCFQFWIPLQTGSSLPEGALVAGHLNDGTPLYTARFFAGSKLIYGYYNPQTKRAHGKETIIRSSSTFEVLIVLEARQVRWPIVVIINL